MKDYIRPTHAIVDLKAIAHNIRVLKEHIGDNVIFMAVVKADAYGHGIVTVAKTAIAAGADWLGVALLGEALELKQKGINHPIFILGIVDPAGAESVVKNNITVAVCNLDSVIALDKAAEETGRNAFVHLKIDTGMGRIGLKPEDVLPFVERLAALKHIQLKNLFSHFSNVDENDKTYAYRQLECFRDVIASLNAKGINTPIKHFAGSVATINFPDSYFDMVRPGISLFGVYPSNNMNYLVDLRPAMTLKTCIIFIKDLPKNVPLSYGNTSVTSKRSSIATLPIGYADGYPRMLSNQGEVLVCGKRVPVVGRLCMDMTMIDIGGVTGAKVGSEVVLFGHQNSSGIPVDEIAYKNMTIPHEIFCGITNRVPKFYRDSPMMNISNFHFCKSYIELI